VAIPSWPASEPGMGSPSMAKRDAQRGRSRPSVV
jgi:hypothetical protein